MSGLVGLVLEYQRYVRAPDLRHPCPVFETSERLRGAKGITYLMAHRFKSYARFLQKHTDMSYQQSIRFIESVWPEAIAHTGQARRDWLLQEYRRRETR